MRHKDNTTTKDVTGWWYACCSAFCLETPCWFLCSHFPHCCISKTLIFFLRSGSHGLLSDATDWPNKHLKTEPSQIKLSRVGANGKWKNHHPLHFVDSKAAYDNEVKKTHAFLFQPLAYASTVNDTERLWLSVESLPITTYSTLYSLPPDSGKFKNTFMTS